MHPHSDVLSLAPPKASRTFLAYPRLPESFGAPSGWMAVSGSAGPDALVMTTRHLSDEVYEQLIRTIGDPYLPVISLVEDDRWWLDAHAGQGPGQAWRRAEEILTRLEALPSSSRHSTRAEYVLLGRMHARDAGLDPIYTPCAASLVSYPVAGLLQEGVAATAERLAQSGHLERRFFDRLHTCPRCSSSLLSVREECHACRSANLREELIVHHFRCAHEAGESAFRSNGRFECPKCGDALRHIGLDYDKPGSVLVCGDCGRADDAAAVGFVCLQCGGRHDAEDMPTRDWFSYRMTALGARQLLSGAIVGTAPGERACDRFRVLLDNAVKEELAFGTPFQVLQVTVSPAGAAAAGHPRQHEQMQSLVVDALHSALREVDTVAQSGESTLVLMPRATPKQAKVAVAHIRKRLAEILKGEPQVACEILPRPDVDQILRGPP